MWPIAPRVPPKCWAAKVSSDCGIIQKTWIYLRTCIHIYTYNYLCTQFAKPYFPTDHRCGPSTVSSLQIWGWLAIAHILSLNRSPPASPLSFAITFFAVTFAPFRRTCIRFRPWYGISNWYTTGRRAALQPHSPPALFASEPLPASQARRLCVRPHLRAKECGCFWGGMLATPQQIKANLKWYLAMNKSRSIWLSSVVMSWFYMIRMLEIEHVLAAHGTYPGPPRFFFMKHWSYKPNFNSH